MLNLLLMTLGLAYLTEHAGLSLALGAFVAGMLVAETEYKHQVETDIRPFHDVLLGLFFISIGMLLRSPYYWPYILCALITIGSKYVIRYRGRHIWNPSNFGIAMMVILAHNAVATLSIQWDNKLYVMLVIWTAGAIIIGRLKRFLPPQIVERVVSGDAEDPNTSNNTGFVEHDITLLADMSVTKAATSSLPCPATIGLDGSSCGSVIMAAMLASSRVSMVKVRTTSSVPVNDKVPDNTPDPSTAIQCIFTPGHTPTRSTRAPGPTGLDPLRSGSMRYNPWPKDTQRCPAGSSAMAFVAH